MPAFLNRHFLLLRARLFRFRIALLRWRRLLLRLIQYRNKLLSKQFPQNRLVDDRVLLKKKRAADYVL